MKNFLILSDIHASSQNPSGPEAESYVSSFNAAAVGRTDPIQELERLIRDHNLEPDFILCAGDITNRSDPASLTYAWQRLNSLASGIGSQLVATVGNHDLDSRYKANGFDPRGYAMALRPEIPRPDRTAFLEYWAEHFTLLEFPDCNILVLNTAAFHGGGSDVQVELEHGRVSEATVAAIGERLASAQSAGTNLVLCHHHPLRADPTDLEHAGQTRGGEKLLEVLEGSHRPWIIVHGHKHRPDLFYSSGSSNAPVILSSASFSAQVNKDAQNKDPNQVHLLRCDPASATKFSLTSAGGVMSWTWQPGAGWREARDEQGLPHRAGFGFRGSTRALAEQVAAHLESSGVETLRGRVAIEVVPEIAYLTPSDFRGFEHALRKLGLEVIIDRNGGLAEVGRP